MLNLTERKKKKTDIASILLPNDNIRGIIGLLFIMKEATDKHQDAETFCYLHYIYESSNTDAYSQKHTNCHFGDDTSVTSATKVHQLGNDISSKPRKKSVAGKSKNGC